MKAKSNQLYQFLKDNDLIGKSKEEIQEAKVKYRKEYLKAWHKEMREESNDIRIRFTPSEFSEIRQKAKQLNISPTMYSKLAVLQENQSPIKIPNKAILQELVQKLGVLGMTALRKCPLEFYEGIEEIENTLIEYLSEK
jgi:uncharacterized protein YnzC (UPF0291/DUF896 family)